MATSTESTPDEANRILRELAVQQGAAFSAYGDALQRFGENRIGWAELIKTSGDIYLGSAAQSLWGLVRANAGAYAWLLSLAGAKILTRRAEAKQRDTSVESQLRRSRR